MVRGVGDRCEVECSPVRVRPLSIRSSQVNPVNRYILKFTELQRRSWPIDVLEEGTSKIIHSQRGLKSCTLTTDQIKRMTGGKTVHYQRRITNLMAKMVRGEDKIDQALNVI